MIAPNTDLILLKSPIELDMQNQLTFSSKEAQYSYFNGLPKLVEDNFTYQRKDNKIRFPAVMDDIIEFNYCMYRNSSYSNKWFYAFITNIEYLNDNTSLITIETDVWQTWMFDLAWKQTFVEREHVNDDTIGKYTLDENLPTGEPICNGAQNFIIASNDNDSQRTVLQVTQLPDGVSVPSKYSNRVYNGIPQGCYFLVISGFSSAQKVASWYDKKGQRDALLAMFLVPAAMVSTAHYEPFNLSDDLGSVNIGFLPQSFNPYNWNPPSTYYSSTLGGYTPKNKKLYTYPFSYMYVSNNAGSDVIYRYEDFDDPTHPAWLVRGTLGQGCSIKLYPNTYKFNTDGSAGYNYGISCAKLPLLSWTSDYYLNWQAQNGTNLAIQTALGAGGDILGINTSQSESSKAGGTLNAISRITNAINEVHKAKLVPEQAMGNTACADLTYSMDRCGFTFYKMSCRAEVAKVVDNYFSMFGYKVNRMKVPNITGRSNWNYVKTTGCNIIAAIPQSDLQGIKDMFDNGVTLWHNPATFQDYSQNNNIV